MHFIVLRTTEARAASAVESGGEHAGARLLMPGDNLAWPTLPPHSRFVVPLLATGSDPVTERAALAAQG